MNLENTLKILSSLGDKMPDIVQGLIQTGHLSDFQNPPHPSLFSIKKVTLKCFAEIHNSWSIDHRGNRESVIKAIPLKEQQSFSRLSFLLSLEPHEEILRFVREGMEEEILEIPDSTTKDASYYLLSKFLTGNVPRDLTLEDEFIQETLSQYPNLLKVIWMQAKIGNPGFCKDFVESVVHNHVSDIQKIKNRPAQLEACLLSQVEGLSRKLIESVRANGKLVIDKQDLESTLTLKKLDFEIIVENDESLKTITGSFPLLNDL
jgi:hypothetical protein